MAGTPTPIFAQSGNVYMGATGAALAAKTQITGTTGLSAVIPTTTNGVRVDQIVCKNQGTSVAGFIGIWIYNGTTAYLYDEIPATAITGSATVASDYVVRTYQNLTLASTESLWAAVSTTQTNPYTIFAQSGVY
jgi:hypothetical protein